MKSIMAGKFLHAVVGKYDRLYSFVHVLSPRFSTECENEEKPQIFPMALP